jgi:uncharacterized repeat protein (TIGR01451 family)
MDRGRAAITGIIALLLLVPILPAGAQEGDDAAPVGGEPAAALAADAFGLEVTVEGAQSALLGAGVGPIPAVDVTMPPQREEQVAQLAELGPIPGDGALVGHVRGVEVRAGGELDDGVARASAETTSISLLGGAITADGIAAVAHATCPDQGTAEDASAGSTFTNLSIGGQAVDATPPPNTRIRLASGGQGIAEVVIRAAVPDTQGPGWTVRGLHVFVLDPLTQLVNAEIIVAEAHAGLDCPSDGTRAPDDEQPDLDIRKEASSATAQPGEELTYEITVENTSAEPCTVYEVIDRLPEGFRFLSAGGSFADAVATTQGRTVRLRHAAGWPLEPGEVLTGTITARISSRQAPGTYYDDAEARSTCGTTRTGPTAPVTIGADEAEPEPPRVGGVERIDTAIEVSREAFDRAEVAILARSDDFPDALTASTLAVEIGGPILLNPPDLLRDEVAAELERLGVERLYLAGGTAALSEAIEAEVAVRGIEPMRLPGRHRYHTAALIADEVVELGGPVEQMIVARADLFPDALVASNVATYGRAPIVLTNPEGPVDHDTHRALRENLQGTRVYIAGGTAAVGTQAEAELAGTGYDITRLGGQDRYGTAVAFATEALRLGADVEPTLLASGLSFSDALVAGPAAHILGGVVMITDPDDLDRPSTYTRTFFEEQRERVETVMIVGGRAAVSDRVAQQVASIVE